MADGKMDSLREWLASRGFSFAVNHMRYATNECDWYAWRRCKGAQPCETNGEKVQIVLWPNSMRHDGHLWESVEVDITGERDGRWYKLMAYSLSPDELMEGLEDIEDSLVRAWNALHIDKEMKHE